MESSYLGALRLASKSLKDPDQEIVDAITSHLTSRNKQIATETNQRIELALRFCFEINRAIAI